MPLGSSVAGGCTWWFYVRACSRGRGGTTILTSALTPTDDLTPTEHAQLTAAARQAGVEPAALAHKLVTEHLPPSTPETPEDPTLALFAQWAAADAQMTPVVARQTVAQGWMACETRHPSLMRHAMALHHLREHTLLGRCGKGHAGGDAVDAAQLNPCEQARAIVREHGHPNEVGGEQRRVEGADGPRRQGGQHGLALAQVVRVTVT